MGLEWTFESFQWWRVMNGVREVVPSPWSGYREGTVTQCWPPCSRHHQVGWSEWPQTTPWFHACRRTDCLLKVAGACWSVWQRYTSIYTEFVLYTFSHPHPVKVDEKRWDVVVVLRTHRETKRAAALMTNCMHAVGQGRSALDRPVPRCSIVKLRHDETGDEHRQRWAR